MFTGANLALHLFPLFYTCTPHLAHCNTHSPSSHLRTNILCWVSINVFFPSLFFFLPRVLLPLIPNCSIPHPSLYWFFLPFRSLSYSVSLQLLPVPLCLSQLFKFLLSPLPASSTCLFSPGWIKVSLSSRSIFALDSDKCSSPHQVRTKRRSQQENREDMPLFLLLMLAQTSHCRYKSISTLSKGNTV